MKSVIINRAFVFVRHGEAEGNVRALCQGKMDFPLTELGRQQALDAASQLSEYREIPKIFSSDLRRAIETAKIIAEQLNCRAIVAVPGLQERGWGELDGESNLMMFKQEELESRPDYSEPSLIAGLEELSVFQIRISTTMNEILQNTEVETPLIIGHGRFFRSLCLLMGVEPEKQIPNAAPLYCHVIDDQWFVKSL